MNQTVNAQQRKTELLIQIHVARDKFQTASEVINRQVRNAGIGSIGLNCEAMLDDIAAKHATLHALESEFRALCN